MAYKIILADSSPAVQRVVQLAFAEPDFEVCPVEDGQEVLPAIGKTAPDCVLLNLSLPSLDGYEILRQMNGREELKRTVVVLLKNAFEPLDGERLKDLTFDEIVSKPFDSEKLAASVKELIERRKIPASFPEEALVAEGPEPGLLPLFQEEEFRPSSLSSFSRDEITEKVSRELREEILSVERELEKRLKASLRTEFKEWLDKERKGQP